MSARRAADLEHFYALLDLLEQKLGSARKLSDCTGRMNWPQRGVYFFREVGERRKHTGRGARIVRVGTHALKTGSKTKLWTRLSQHRGQLGTGGGNHRGSIFRSIVGTALIARDRRRCWTWGEGSSASREIRLQEHHLEKAVSETIRHMPFLWLAIEDDPGPDSLRGYIERNAIALLSNFDRQALDPPSRNWLGNFCDRERVRKSGLWNQNHVDETYDPAFLGVLEELIAEMAAPA